MVRRIPYTSDIAALVVRVALGVVFVAHGWQKLVDYGHAGTTKAFGAMGVPLPAISAFYATWVELLGGLALILGVVTHLVALLLFLDMLGAFAIVHAGNGLFVGNQPPGFELVLVLGAASLALVLVGAGRFSVDVLVRRRSGVRPPA